MTVHSDMKPRKRKDSPFYFIEYQYIDKNGIKRRRRESLDTSDYREAVSRAKKRQAALLKENIVEIEDGITIKEFFDDYIRSIHKLLKPKSIEIIQNSINYFMNIVGEDTRMNRISDRHMDSLIEYRKKLGHSIGTINTDIRKIKTAFEFALQREYVKKNPFQYRKQLKEHRPANAILTIEQIGEIRKLLSDEYLTLFEFYINTGARRNEILNLEWKHIKKSDIIIYGKGNETRIVPINKKLRMVIDGMEKGVGKLFALEETRVSELFTKTIAEVGGEGSCHTLRRTYISHMLMAGVEVVTVANITGHRDVKTLIQQYAHILDQHRRTAVEKLPY
ncbi:tyrosine-type recombinase/integrase [Seleniivibrio woodruffii]|uniref:tyrosine-type recombinase/integrase n=1 Tax=Seleniivibrio woodruffii TaxID=1078050 RepID=UPI00240A8E73|nr:tyrosine-type recombinase/integrase [Seleniivibrio woodruffii]